MAMTVVGGLLLQWPIGRISDRIDRRLILAIVSVATTIVAAVIAAVLLVPEWTGFVTWLLPGIAPLLGGAVFTIYPLSCAHTNDYVEPADLVSASAGLILAYGIGAIVGPQVASGLMEVLGPVGLFVFFGACGLMIAAFAFWRIARREALPAEERDPFQVVTRTTPLATELHPGVEPDEPTLDLVIPVDHEPGNEPPAAEDAA
jgi:MFS family permease